MDANPYRSRPLVVHPRPVPHPLAGRLLRFVSGGIDFVVLLTLHFAFCSYLMNDEALDAICSLVPITILVVYEIGLATSVGKQLLGLKLHFDYSGFRFRLYRAVLKYGFIPMIVFPFVFFTARRQGLHDKAAKSVVVQPNGWTAWARASIGVVLACYAMVTFGCGTLLATALQERYDHRIVSLEPERWDAPAQPPDGWHALWAHGARLALPPEVAGVRLRGTPSLFFYNEPRGLTLEGPRVAVLISRESLRAELCDDSSPGLAWLLPCHLSPREFQKEIFETTMEANWFLNPRTLLSENAKRLLKGMLLKGDELVDFRLVDRPELSLSVVWYAIARYDEQGNVASVVDQLELGGDAPDDHLAIMVFWSGRERRPDLVEGLAASLAFDRGSEELGQRLLEEGGRRRAPLRLLSALHLAADKLPAAEALYRLYEGNGSPFEKRMFAIWVSYRIESGDLSLMDLNERVWDWRGVEPPDLE